MGRLLFSEAVKQSPECKSGKQVEQAVAVKHGPQQTVSRSKIFAFVIKSSLIFKGKKVVENQKNKAVDNEENGKIALGGIEMFSAENQESCRNNQ